jgi:F-type H+-transporting ATPase subunit gamma
MKMVAAAKLKKAQDAVLNFRPYALKMQEIMTNVSSSLENDGNVFADERDYRQVLIVVITSNRGLCGAFNSNAVKEAVLLAEKKYSAHVPQGKIRYMALGKKGYDMLRKRKVQLEDCNTAIVENPAYENVSEVAYSLMDSFTTGRYDSIDIVYNEFINAATQKVVCKQFLPLLPEEHEYKADKKKMSQTDYIFEPNKEHIVQELIPQNLKLMLYEALLDSVASEFGARMTSMHQATDNATTLIQELTLQYNKARQAAITNEILEIVGGAEALKG